MTFHRYMPQSSSGCSIATHPGHAGNKTIPYDEHHRDDRAEPRDWEKSLLRRFIQTPNTRLLLGARRGGLLGAETFPLDLMRLESVRSFASTVDRELGHAQIDSLVLNAGLLFPNAGFRSADGFEAAFAVNHLAHYLLLRLLLPRLAQGATVILTTSGTHDPAERTIIAPPLHADARYLAHPERDPNRDPHPLIAGGRDLFFLETLQPAHRSRARRPTRYNGAPSNHYRLRSRPHSGHRPCSQPKFRHQFALETIRTGSAPHAAWLEHSRSRGSRTCQTRPRRDLPAGR